MSRIGKKPISLPNEVEITVADTNLVTVKGPKGTLSLQVVEGYKVIVDNGVLEVERPSESKAHRTMHGTTRALLNNLVVGVTDGFKKQLVMKGVGYRASLKGNTLVILAGYSHPVEMEIPEGLSVEVPKNTEITVFGIDKQLVGEFSANIRAVRPPEPYLGKGIRYVDEHVRRKEGKTA